MGQSSLSSRCGCQVGVALGTRSGSSAGTLPLGSHLAEPQHRHRKTSKRLEIAAEFTNLAVIWLLLVVGGQPPEVQILVAGPFDLA